MAYRKMLASKIQGLRITGKNLEYTGSITLPRTIIEKAKILPYEMVQVINVNNGERFETYVIPGEEGKVELNGGAARLGEIGDKLIVFSHIYLTEEEMLKHKPIIIIVNEKNEIVEIK